MNLHDCSPLNKQACTWHACWDIVSQARSGKQGRNCSWHDFASSIITSGISALCLYGAIQLCTKHMVGFPEILESSPSPEQMEFCGNYLSKLVFLGILFGGLLARIAEYLLNGSPREVKFHIPPISFTHMIAPIGMRQPIPMSHQMNYMGQQFVYSPSPPAAPAPSPGAMMPYYAPYPQPHPF